ncbi:hypothetical protein Godav_015196 [Gossypium davidsonii]|uniref:Ribosomal protein L10e/L16 domain-containing protein n=2 Tax=Gossypium TaxID=3633 RepID=A0A7J8RMR4_GOSDV|nr:hypothetical protein [Gossypium davidsonii]
MGACTYPHSHVADAFMAEAQACEQAIGLRDANEAAHVLAREECRLSEEWLWIEEASELVERVAVDFVLLLIFFSGFGEFVGFLACCSRRYAPQALEPVWITSRQIKVGRQAMTWNVRYGGKIWVHIFPDKPVTGRPTETRMGLGKGSFEYWVTVTKPRKIIYEISGVTENIARKAISTAAPKMAIKTKFIISG